MGCATRINPLGRVAGSRPDEEVHTASADGDPDRFRRHPASRLLWSFLYWGSDTASTLRSCGTLVERATFRPPTTMGHHLPLLPGMFFVQGGLVELSGLDSPTR